MQASTPGTGAITYGRPQLFGGMSLLRGEEFTGQYRPHLHDSFVIGVVVRGRLDLALRGRVHRLGPGDILLLNPHDLHAESADLVRALVRRRVTGAGPGADDCGQVTVQDNPTVVSHVLATGAISLTHAGQTYSGTVAANGTFLTDPKTVSVGDGFLYTISIPGHFTGNGLSADPAIDRTTEGTSCRFLVHWEGTRR